MALLLSGAFASWYFFLKKTAVKVQNFITISIPDVPDGYADADIVIDFDKLTSIIGYKNLSRAFRNSHTDQEIADYAKQYQFDPDNIEGSRNGKAFLNAANFIEAYISEYKNLSNNSEVRIIFKPTALSNYDTIEELAKALKIVLEPEYVYTVKGLEKGEEIDIMPDNIIDQIVFSGLDGNCTAAFSWEHDSYTFGDYYLVKLSNDTGTVSLNNTKLGTIKFKIIPEDANKPADKLSQGDKVKVIVEADEDLTKALIKNKLVIKNRDISITVPELNNYITADQLSTEQLISLSEPIVLEARNTHQQTRTTNLALIKSAVKQDGSNPLIIYLFKTTIGEYFIVYGNLYSSDNASGAMITDLTTSPINKNPDELLSQFAEYDVIDINDPAVLDYKYALGKTGVVIKNGLNIRSGPGVYYDAVKVNGSTFYHDNEHLDIIDEQRDVDGDIWYQVKFTRSGTDYTYWASGFFVSVVY